MEENEKLLLDSLFYLCCFKKADSNQWCLVSIRHFCDIF